MHLKPKLLIICLLIAPICVRAAEVLEFKAEERLLAITQSEDTAGFKEKDYLCVVDDDEEVGCGIVIKATKKGAIIKLDFVNGGVSAGDKVQFAGGRYPATIQYERSVLRTPMNRRKFVYPFDFSGGAIGSQFYVLPNFLFQGMVTPRIAIGLEGIYSRQTGTNANLKAYGGFLTVNYYSWRYFRGFWFRGGAGLLFTNTEGIGGDESSTSPMALGSVGFRFGIAWGINIGVSVGGMYIKKPTTQNITFEFNEIQPVGTIDLGISL